MGSHLNILGIDIGSTSTKAAILDRKNTVIAGFYTRTAGRSVKAVQKLFEAVELEKRSTKLEIRKILELPNLVG